MFFFLSRLYCLHPFIKHHIVTYCFFLMIFLFWHFFLFARLKNFESDFNEFLQTGNNSMKYCINWRKNMVPTRLDALEQTQKDFNCIRCQSHVRALLSKIKKKARSFCFNDQLQVNNKCFIYNKSRIIFYCLMAICSLYLVRVYLRLFLSFLFQCVE